MKLKYIIGILTLLILTSSIASAATTIPVNNFNPGDPVPPSTSISATYDGNKITVLGTSSLTNFDIKEIYVFSKPYNQATGVDNLDHTETWTYTNNPSGIPGTPAYFRTPPAEEFTTNCLGEASIKNGGRIETTFTNNVEPIAYDSKGFSIVVHIGWEDSSGVGKSAWVGNGYNGYIPEFPTIALPVAGILGLMLILGRRNKE